MTADSSVCKSHHVTSLKHWKTNTCLLRNLYLRKYLSIMRGNKNVFKHIKPEFTTSRLVLQKTLKSNRQMIPNRNRGRLQKQSTENRNHMRTSIFFLPFWFFLKAGDCSNKCILGFIIYIKCKMYAKNTTKSVVEMERYYFKVPIHDNIIWR